MPASEARKKRRAARPEAGLPQATPTIASDLGDQNVGAKRVAVRRDTATGEIVVDKPQRESSGKIFYATPGAPPSAVTAGPPPLSAHHTDLMNIVAGLRSAAEALIPDEAHRNGVISSLNRVVRHIHNSAALHAQGLHHESIPGMAAAVTGIGNATELLSNKTPGSFRYGNQSFGVLEKAFPVHPTVAASNTLQSYIGDNDGTSTQ